MADIKALLAESAARHSHLCPRQVLGVRAGLLGLAIFGYQAPLDNKQIIAIAETDGCFVDGLEVATRLTVGHRTLRIEDYGKIAVTFVHATNGDAYRVSPRPDVRQTAWEYASEESEQYAAQLHAYRVMPDSALLYICRVELVTPVEKIISTPGIRTICDSCGEEIINERSVSRNGLNLCRSCSGESYYHIRPDEQSEYFSLLTNSANTHTDAPPDNSLP